MLVHWKLLPLPLLYLSAFFERHRDDYYDKLLAVSERGAWAAWVGFFLRGVAEQARDAAGKAKRLQDLQLDWWRQLQQARKPGLLLGIADLLFEMPMLSTHQVQERFGVSPPTARQALRRLVEMHILKEVTGRERNRLYRSDAILQALE